MTTRDVAWAAGLYEGEGSVGMSRSRRYPRLALGMTDREPVEWFRDILGFGSIYEQHFPPGDHRKSMYRFEAGGWVHVALVRGWFEPYLSPRRLAQFDELLAQRPSRPTSPDCGEASPAAYRRHRRRGEPPCAPCRAANTAYERDRTGSSARYTDRLGYLRGETP